MVRPMNEREITLGTRCDACSDLATHCDSEMTDFPLSLCTVHAFEQAIKHGGTVRPGISPTPDGDRRMEGAERPDASAFVSELLPTSV